MSLKLGTTDISGVPTTLINTVNNKLDASVYTSNPRTNAVYITDTYHSGASWYRVWSDNWCEQGGIATGGNNATGAAVSFIKTFANTNYSLYASGCTRQSETFSNQGAQVVKIRNLSTTGFNAATSWVASSSYGWASYDFSWYACGYIS